MQERPDLPLFYVIESQEGMLCVSLSGRSMVGLDTFVEHFLSGGIRFARSAWTRPRQRLKLIFYEMPCWKCGASNHVYCIDGVLRASCNAEIHRDEALWESDRLLHRPEIIAAARKYVSSPEGAGIRLGEMKERYSRTVDKSYMSFGCHVCDSIFGEWFVLDAELEVLNGYGIVSALEISVDLQPPIELSVPHWCYPAGGDFCE